MQSSSAINFLLHQVLFVIKSIALLITILPSITVFKLSVILITLNMSDKMLLFQKYTQSVKIMKNLHTSMCTCQLIASGLYFSHSSLFKL